MGSDAVIERIIADQHDRPLPELIDREGVLPTPDDKAVALLGMRRTGKTYRLFQEMKRPLADGAPRDRLLYLNLEDDRLGQVDLPRLDRALEIFFRRSSSERTAPSWLFFDEVQVVEGWERFVRRVLDTEAARVFVTGSSARQLSTEIATSFRGRSITLEVLPFSVREAATDAGVSWRDGAWPPGAARRSRLDQFIVQYLECGGFPAVHDLDPWQRIQILQEYVDLVVLRDVVERHGSSNLAVLRELTAALFAANTNGFSVSRLHGALRSQGWKVSKATLLTYVDHLVDACLFHLVPIRSRSARVRAVNPRKAYCVDPGLAAAMYRAGAINRGAQLENVVYLELRRQFGRLTDSVVSWYKTNSGKEIDFVVDNPVTGGPPALLQVCADMSADATRSREVTALVEAMEELGTDDATIVTLSHDETLATAVGAVDVTPARQWLFRAV